MGQLDIQAGGFVGIAFETTWGTFVPATVFFPVRSCDLNYTQDTSWRRPIRGVADNLGGIAGYSSVAGTIEMELLDNILPYFLYVARMGIVKSGSTPNFTYTATPTHWGTQQSLPATKKGLSITVVKAGEAFGFEGCVVSGMEFGVDGNVPTVTFTIVGEDEATAAVPTYVESSNSVPYGAGNYDLEIPTSTDIFDVDTFTFNIEDAAEPQHRLTTSRIPRFIKWGERTITASVERDFSSRTEYDAFKALTSTTARLAMSRGANNSVELTLPRAVPETFEPGTLSSQGDLVRASIQYQGTYDNTTSRAGQIVVKTQTDIT